MYTVHVCLTGWTYCKKRKRMSFGIISIIDITELSEEFSISID